jgi:outer membrane protein TolC
MLGLSFMINAVPAMAAELGIDEIVSMALTRNESVGIAKNQLEKAVKQIEQVESGLFPEINLAVTGTTSHVWRGGTETRQWVEGGELSLAQPLYTFGKLSSAISAAKSFENIAENNERATEAEVSRVAKGMYYGILYSQKLVEIRRESFQNAAKNKEALEKRVSSGRIGRNENLKMQADLASRRPSLIEAEQALETNLLDLGSFLALEEEAVKVKGDLASVIAPNPSDGKKVEVAGLVDLRIAEEGIKAADAATGLARADLMPNLSFFANYAPATNRRDPFDERLGGQDALAVGIRLDMAWPTGGGKLDEIAIKKIDKRNAELSFQKKKREIEVKHKSLLLQYKSLSKKLKASKEAVELAESSYRVALGSFTSGNISQSQLNDSELLLTQNKISYAQNLLQIHLIGVELERVMTSGVASKD